MKDFWRQFCRLSPAVQTLALAVALVFLALLIVLVVLAPSVTIPVILGLLALLYKIDKGPQPPRSRREKASRPHRGQKA